MLCYLFYVAKKLERYFFSPILANQAQLPAVASLTLTPLEEWRPVVQQRQSPEEAFKG